jgi:hypothetical protein
MRQFTKLTAGWLAGSGRNNFTWTWKFGNMPAAQPVEPEHFIPAGATFCPAGQGVYPEKPTKKQATGGP